MFFNEFMFDVLNFNILEIMAKKNVQIRYRDAETGEYVTKEYAKKNPKTTVKETDKRK